MNYKEKCVKTRTFNMKIMTSPYVSDAPEECFDIHCVIISCSLLWLTTQAFFKSIQDYDL